jgi:cob(I)alamin adenosyltransferase
MAEVAATLENSEHFRVIDESRVVWLEEQINALSKEVEVPKEFIIPGDSQSGAALALSRTVVRRAERRLSRLLLEDELENIELLRYLNRLSSLCFALELFENQVGGKQDLTFANE